MQRLTVTTSVDDEEIADASSGLQALLELDERFFDFCPGLRRILFDLEDALTDAHMRRASAHRATSLWRRSRAA